MTIKRGGEIHRLKIINGHLNKVIDMVEQEEDCIKTMQQLEAVISALKKTEEILLEKYLRKCLKSNLKNTTEGTKLHKEMIDLFLRN